MKIKFRKETKELICISSPAINGDAGYDIYAASDSKILSRNSGIVKTGLFLELPKGYWFEIMPKSGLATKFSIAVHNGVIDNGYRGEILIHIYNHGDTDYLFRKNDKVCQGVLRKIHTFDLEEIHELSETQRGTKGFGSTGK
ncbi:MAG: dUTP diphosphatase [Mycoplasmoidaceae bacterium]